MTNEKEALHRLFILTPGIRGHLCSLATLNMSSQTLSLNQKRNLPTLTKREVYVLGTSTSRQQTSVHAHATMARKGFDQQKPSRERPLLSKADSMLPGDTKSGGPLNRENESDVNALFRWSCLRPHCIGIVNVGELQLMETYAKFHFLFIGVKILRELRKLNEIMTFKDGKHFFTHPVYMRDYKHRDEYQRATIWNLSVC